MHFSMPGRDLCRTIIFYLFSAEILSLTFSFTCHALTLTDMLDLARNSEPTYLSTKSNLQASQARESQALGALLPQVSADLNTNMNHRKYDTRNRSIPEQQDEFNNHIGQIKLTQPLWRRANIIGYSQAESATQQAEYQLESAEQELLGKLVTAWFDLMSARDEILLATHQVSAMHKQWEIAKRGAELGYSDIPRLDEAEAKYEDARASRANAETDCQLKLAALEQLTGPSEDFSPPFIRQESTFVDERMDTLDAWLLVLETQNPSILAAQQAFEAAEAEVRKQYAGHQPTLDLVASYNSNSQSVGNFPGQDGYQIDQWAVGLELNLPIYSGGAQDAKVREAIALQEKAALDIDAARRTATLSAKQAWFSWKAALAKVKAAEQGIKAGNSALRVAKSGTVTGLKTELDILQAEQQQETARRDLNRARYSQITSLVKLKTLVGQATRSDVIFLDSMFEYHNDSLSISQMTQHDNKTNMQAQKNER